MVFTSIGHGSCDCLVLSTKKKIKPYRLFMEYPETNHSVFVILALIFSHGRIWNMSVLYLLVFMNWSSKCQICYQWLPSGFWSIRVFNYVTWGFTDKMGMFVCHVILVSPKPYESYVYYLFLFHVKNLVSRRHISDMLKTFYKVFDFSVLISKCVAFVVHSDIN